MGIQQIKKKWFKYFKVNLIKRFVKGVNKIWQRI